MTLDDKIECEILDFLAKTLDRDIRDLNDIDSLDNATLLVCIEEEYQFTIPKEYTITTIEELVFYIYKKSPKYKK